MVGRFTTTLDCVDTGFLPENTLDQLPLPSRIGATRIGGIDLNKPRIRSTLAAVLALAAAPGGFSVQDLATKVHTMTGQTTYTTRQAAYDLRKLRGKELITKPDRSRRYHPPPQPARIITALLALREQVISPILAGIRSPRMGRKPPTGPASTATTKPSASPCKPSSTTSASPPSEPLRHRQLFVDRGPASA
jgi:hypothetical protein